MATLATKLQQAEQKNTELTAQLSLREKVHSAVVNDLDRQQRVLQEEAERWERELKKARAERQELESFVKVGDVLSLLHLKARKSLKS